MADRVLGECPACMVGSAIASLASAVLRIRDAGKVDCHPVTMPFLDGLCLPRKPGDRATKDATTSMASSEAVKALAR